MSTCAQLANEAGPVTYSSKRLGEESAFYGLSLSSFREQMDVVELAKDVMICYSRADLSFLKVLSDALNGRSLSVWYDTQDIDKGTSWVESISVAIRDCKAIVFMVSQSSLQSTYCKEELLMARAHGKPIFPVALDSSGKLLNSLPNWALIIVPIQWTFLSEDAWNESEFHKLSRCIERAIGRPPTSSFDEGMSEFEFPVQEGASDALSFHDFWSVSFPENTTKIDCLELCRKLTGRCATQLSLIGGEENMENLFGRSELQEAISVLCNHIALMMTGKEAVKGGEGLEVERHLVMRLLDLKEDDQLIKRLVDYWCQFDAIKRSLLSHLRSKGLAMLGSGINVKNVHYYISLASYRSQDGSIDPGEPIVKEGRGKIQSPADDANIRSQATLALGCTTDQDPKLRSLIVERISANLDDRDRLVREAASRALGRLKAVRCVPKLISVWRNDFIHPVRVAAREVLLKLADEFAEARDAMDLTEKLQEEMNGY